MSSSDLLKSIVARKNSLAEINRNIIEIEEESNNNGLEIEKESNSNVLGLENNSINNIIEIEKESNRNILDNILDGDKADSRNKTFYLRVDVLEAIERVAKQKKISESKLVNEILKSVLT